MLGEKRRDWLEDVLEGDEVFVEQAALLHQVQAGGQTRQPGDGKENTPRSTQPRSGLETLQSDFLSRFHCRSEAGLSFYSAHDHHLMIGQLSAGA